MAPKKLNHQHPSAFVQKSKFDTRVGNFVNSHRISSETSHTGLLVRLTSIFDWVGSLSAEDSPEPSVQALVTTFETLAQVTEIHATVAGSNDSSEVDYVEQMCLSQLKEWSESIEDWSNLAQAIRIDTVVNVIRGKFVCQYL